MNIGVIGLGRWGSIVYNKYKYLENKNIIDHVYSCDKQVNADYKQPKQLIDKVDAVHICTPNSTHYNLGKLFLENNIPCLIEKPMTTNTKQNGDLVALAKKQELVLQVGYLLRYSNLLDKTRKLVNQINNIQYFKAIWTSLPDKPYDGGIIWDLFPHVLDSLCYIFEQHPNKDSTCLIRQSKHDILKTVAFINLRYDTLIGNIELSYLLPEKKRKITFIGDSMISADFVNNRLYDSDRGWIPITSDDPLFNEINHFIYRVEKNYILTDNASVLHTGFIEQLYTEVVV